MSKEPSMEEILSSIKRIIAEDGEEGEVKPARAERRSRAKDAAATEPVDDLIDEILELTEAMPEDDAQAGADALDFAGLNASADDGFDELDDVDDLIAEISAPPVVPHPAPAPAPVAPAAAPVKAAKAGESSIVSQESEAAARASLAALSSLIVKPSEPAAAENTLEGLVREMLRPMMKDWLDANLPRLVEGMVAKEIARITGRTL